MLTAKEASGAWARSIRVRRSGPLGGASKTLRIKTGIPLLSSRFREVYIKRVLRVIPASSDGKV